MRRNQATRLLRASTMLATLLATAMLAGCSVLDFPGSPFGRGSGDPEPPGPGPVQHDPTNREHVLEQELTDLDISPQCADGYVPREAHTDGSGPQPGYFRYEHLEIVGDGDEILLVGSFSITPFEDYTGLFPMATVINDHDLALGRDPIWGSAREFSGVVVTGRLTSRGNDAPPEGEIALRIRLGTCDGEPLPEGPLRVTLFGALPDADPDGLSRTWPFVDWIAPTVDLQVLDGRLQLHEGEHSPGSGPASAPVNDVGLSCGDTLAARGEEPPFLLELQQGDPEVPFHPFDDGTMIGIGADATVRARTTGVEHLALRLIITDLSDGTIVSGSFTEENLSPYWLTSAGAEVGVENWTSRACGVGLELGTYQAQIVALTVDQDGEPVVVVSEPWQLDVVEP